MGKNYTLYIRCPEFQDEDNKSGLVNRLLKEHYGGFKPPEVIKTIDETIVPTSLSSDSFKSVPAQLEELGYKHDPTRPNMAFDPEIEQYVPYTVVAGVVKIGGK